MTTLAVTRIISSYHQFERDFWLSYKALEAVMDEQEWNMIKMQLLKSKRIDDKILSKVNRKDYEQKRDELDKEWKKKNDDAKASGTATHEYLHNLLCTEPDKCKAYGIPTDQYKLEKAEAFLNSNGLFPEFRMEIPLGDDYCLVGIPDLIIKDGNSIKIVDYKTDDKIERDSHYDVAKKKKKSMRYPLSKLPDCNLVHYQLQLSIYAWMLQQMNPDFTIDGLEIIQIKDNKVKKVYPVVYLQKEVEHLIKWHLKATKLKAETDKCKEIKYV